MFEDTLVKSVPIDRRSDLNKKVWGSMNHSARSADIFLNI